MVYIFTRSNRENLPCLRQIIQELIFACTAKYIFMNSNKAFSAFIHITLVFFLLVFFGLMFFLALYNHPHTDDYIAMCDVRDYGYWGYEKHIYLTWGGRYLSQYLTKIEAYHNFMLHHYYVHTYVLLVLQFVSTFFLLSVVNKYLASFTTP